MIIAFLIALLPVAVVIVVVVAADLLMLLWFCNWSVPAMIRWLIAAAQEQNEIRSL